MPYIALETALISRIVTSTDFASTNVTAGDYRVLAGGPVRAVVTNPIESTPNRKDLTFRWIQDDWLIKVDLYTRYNGELKTLQTDMATNRQTLIDTLEKWPALNGSTGVYRARLRSIAPGVGPDPANHAQYGMQTFVFMVSEIYDPGRLEP